VKIEEVLVPHVGWFLHEAGDEVARYLDEGWYEYREQAFMWLYAREDDVFIDCGAHFGLYSVLYGSAAGRASIWAIEPNPSTLPFLKRNLKLHDRLYVSLWRGQTAILSSALSSRPGEAAFYFSGAANAAYSGFHPLDPSGSSFAVPCTTLDRMCADYDIARAGMVKLDVEGAEIEVLQGGRESIAAGRFPLLMVEFTERNLARAGHTSQDLFRELETGGYKVCRFDEQKLELIPLQYSGPVYYENYFAALDPESVNSRLRGAPSRHRRIARAVLRRGNVCAAIHAAALGANDANARAGQAQELLEQAWARIGEANWHVDDANARASQTRQLLEEAWARIGEANWRVDDANARVSQTRRLLEEAWARIGEANWRVDEANARAEDASRELEHIRSNRYVRFLRKLRLLGPRKTGPPPA
jgi:FkbM family methyltransferase